MNGKEIFRASKEAIEQISIGYVYVLHDESFEPAGFQQITKDSLKPVIRIPVEKEDLGVEIEEYSFLGDNPEKQLSQTTLEQMKYTALKQYSMTEGIHGTQHIQRVLKNTITIIQKEYPEGYNAAVVGALLHDVGRENDEGGNNHAYIGAIKATNFIKTYLPNLQDKEKVLYAIKHHADGMTTKDPIIGAIWDGDRLDLKRCGRKIDESYLSTATGKSLLRARRKIELVLGTSCNNNCIPCPYRNANKWEKSSAEVRKEIDSFRCGSGEIKFSGGEPTIRNDLPELIKYVKKKCQRVSIKTNGRAFAYLWLAEKLNKSGLDHAIIKLPAHTRNLYRNICGVDGYGQVLRGIENLRNLRQSFSINVNVSHNNIADLPLIAKHHTELGAESIHIKWNIQQEHEKHIKHLFEALAVLENTKIETEITGISNSLLNKYKQIYRTKHS